ncbi:sirohydrochlorin chelatase [Spongiactinospora sp. 9N601]|uniref:sirohydrochlorin chelatase n=1 Tax=Spongiactinospora sp. 9N601 TaxID=3375149 RepID=UPI0037A7F276
MDEVRAPYHADPVTRRVVLVGGHESGYGQALGGLEPEAVAPGRELSAVLAAPAPVAVVPMTLGRDPDLLRDAAQTLAWARRGRRGGELLLTEPLSEVNHLVSLLLAAARGNAAKGRAALLVAPAASPEADAELFRVARLVRDGADLVEVALLGGDPDLAEGVERCLRLGAESVAVLPAAFVRPPLPADPRIVDGGPLLGPAAMVRLVRERVTTAEERFSRYDEDGITAVLAARDHHHHEGADHHGA